MWATCTLQHLDPDGVFAVHAGLIALTACPVACNIVEALVELAVLEVVLGHEACAAGGVNEVIKADHAGGCRGTHRLVLICSGNGAASSVVVHKIEGGDLGVLKEGDARCSGMAEEEPIEL